MARGLLSQSRAEKAPPDEFAFPKERKESINDAGYLCEAVARFDLVEGVSNRERDAAWNRIERAAKKYEVEPNEKDWRGA